MMDDVVVYGANKKEPNRNLNKVLQTIKESGLKLNKNKCHFGKSDIKRMG